jgi:hypothetical protein
MTKYYKTKNVPGKRTWIQRLFRIKVPDKIVFEECGEAEGTYQDVVLSRIDNIFHIHPETGEWIRAKEER